MRCGGSARAHGAMGESEHMSKATEQPVYDFELADRAYGLFTLVEKRRALEIMATLRFASVTDRFFEAVSRVIKETQP